MNSTELKDDWARTFSRTCEDCGFDPSGVDDDRVSTLISTHVARWRFALAQPKVSARPRPGQWSTLEYGCHVCDVLGVFGFRLAQSLTTELPTVPNWDQETAAIVGEYVRLQPSHVAVGIADAGKTNALLYERLVGPEWERGFKRSDGRYLTIRQLSRYLLHELEHHLWDVRAPAAS